MSEPLTPANRQEERIRIINEPESSFSKVIPGLRLAWDATSLSLLKTCPYKYHLNYVLGYVPERMPLHLKWGILYHRGVEEFDKALAAGADRQQALRLAVNVVLSESGELSDGNWTPWDTSSEKKGSYLNLVTLVRALVWYEARWRDDKRETYILPDGKPAVELSFRLALDDIAPPTSEKYLLCGHLDKVVRFAGQLWVLDRKAQPVSTKVLGPDGWVQIRDLNVGDRIAGRDGKFHKVSGVYPKGTCWVYRVSFNDGAAVLAGDDHLWSVGNNSCDNWRTVSTAWLLEHAALKSNDINSDGRKFHVPLVEPIQHERRTLPLDPYLLGVLLGDGCLGGHSVQLSSNKLWLIEEVRKVLPEGHIICKDDGANLIWTIKTEKRGDTNHVLRSIQELGLFGKRAWEKFIPQQYLFASPDQRKELLRGLMDTDGCKYKQYLYYSSTSPQLIDDVCALVRSLGGSAKWRKSTPGKNSVHQYYRIGLRLPNGPLAPKRRYIVDIEQVANDETACVKVDAEDELYVTENYIVTHNTTSRSGGIDEKYWRQFRPNCQVSLYTIAANMLLPEPVAGVIIDAAHIKVNSLNFAFRCISRTEQERDEWWRDTMFWIKMAERFAESGDFVRNDTSCSDFFGCEFQGVCGSPPALRERMLENGWTRKPPWNPLENR